MWKWVRKSQDLIGLETDWEEWRCVSSVRVFEAELVSLGWDCIIE